MEVIMAQNKPIPNPERKRLSQQTRNQLRKGGAHKSKNKMLPRKQKHKKPADHSDHGLFHLSVTLTSKISLTLYNH